MTASIQIQPVRSRMPCQTSQEPDLEDADHDEQGDEAGKIPEDVDPLVDEGLALIDDERHAGSIDVEDLGHWQCRIETGIGKVLADEPPERDSYAANTYAGVARALDVLERRRPAADLYRRAVELGDLSKSTTQRAAVDECRLRLLLHSAGQEEQEREGDVRRVIDLLTEVVPYVEERYLSAVLDEEVQLFGRLLAKALDYLAFGHAQEGAWDDALRILDTGKNLRLRPSRGWGDACPVS